MDYITPEQYKSIVFAKEELREHLSEDLGYVAPDYIRRLANAYIEPSKDQPSTRYVLGVHEYSDLEDPPIVPAQIITNSATIELERRNSQVRLAHVLTSPYQPPSNHKFRTPITATHLGKFLLSDSPVLIDSESLLLEYDHSHKIGFIVLNGPGANSRNQFRIADMLLKLPDNPSYIK